jgi:hypothetical protein
LYSVIGVPPSLVGFTQEMTARFSPASAVTLSGAVIGVPPGW